MELKTINVNGKEKEIVVSLEKEAIENNDDIINMNKYLEDTIDLSKTIKTISEDLKNE